jgi:hypothetical protein
MNSQFKKTLSARQRRLLELFQKRPERDLDELMVVFKGEIWRASLISSIKSISAKMVPHGYHIIRTTPLGRGNRATYEMKKL